MTAEKCPWCGQIHEVICPMVKEIEYFRGTGKVKRVRFKVPAD